MTRKDFELIAAVFRQHAGQAANTGTDARTHSMLANEMARALRTTNPAFNAQRFLAACGL